MPEDDARSMLHQIEERIRSSEIDVQHRDVLIRLRSLIEEDLTTASQGTGNAAGARPRSADIGRNPRHRAAKTPPGGQAGRGSRRVPRQGA